MPISPAELIVKKDGSIYHLNLKPGQVAPLILTVGDPERVPKVSKYFDSIEHKVQKREFITHTGRLAGRPITVISTGIGTDNIDIAVNEIDALFNIDLETREPKSQLQQLTFIRVGTSGSLQKNLPLGSFLASSMGIGMDNLMRYYAYEEDPQEKLIREAFLDFAIDHLPVEPYVALGSEILLKKFTDWNQGITLTCPGFYAPQGRQLRLRSRLNLTSLKKFAGFEAAGQQITNFEMETSALYGMARLLGHQAISCSVLIANRLDQTFSADPGKDEENLIKAVLDKCREL